MTQKILLVKEVNGTALLMGSGDPNIGLVNPVTYTTTGAVNYINTNPAGSSLVWVYNFSSGAWTPDPGAGLFIGELVAGSTPGALLFVNTSGRLAVSTTLRYTPGTTIPVGTPDVIHFGGNDIRSASTSGNVHTLPSKSGTFALLQDCPVYGQASLSSSTVITVADTRVKSTSIIMLTSIGTPLGIEYTVDNIVDGVSFDIRSSSPVTATVSYMINDHY